MIVEFSEQAKPGQTPGFRGNIDPAFNPTWAKKLKGTVVEQIKKVGGVIFKVDVGGDIKVVEADRCRVVL